MNESFHGSLNDPARPAFSATSFIAIAPVSQRARIMVPAGVSPYEEGDENQPDRVLSKSFNQDGTLPHRGIFDTGATNSLISLDLAERLALPVVNKRKVRTAGGVVEMTVRTVNFVLPNKAVFPFKYASTAPLVGFDFILGMDIISQGNVTIDSRHGHLTLIFTMYHTDAGPPQPPADATAPPP